VDACNHCTVRLNRFLYDTYSDLGAYLHSSARRFHDPRLFFHTPHDNMISPAAAGVVIPNAVAATLTLLPRPSYQAGKLHSSPTCVVFCVRIVLFFWAIHATRCAHSNVEAAPAPPRQQTRRRRAARGSSIPVISSMPVLHSSCRCRSAVPGQESRRTQFASPCCHVSVGQFHPAAEFLARGLDRERERARRESSVVERLARVVVGDALVGLQAELGGGGVREGRG